MLSRLMDFLTACWRRRGSSSDGKGSEVSGRKEGLLWYKDAGQHLFGEYSMAVVQANNLLEDQSQIESGPLSLLDTGPYIVHLLPPPPLLPPYRNHHAT